MKSSFVFTCASLIITMLVVAIMTHRQSAELVSDFQLQDKNTMPLEGESPDFTTTATQSQQVMLVSHGGANVAASGEVDAAYAAELDKKLDRVISLMDRLDQRQANFQRQLAETNRDLTELHFRVDTHDESFRPLKLKYEPPKAQTEFAGDHMLLPPKM